MKINKEIGNARIDNENGYSSGIYDIKKDNGKIYFKVWAHAWKNEGSLVTNRWSSGLLSSVCTDSGLNSHQDAYQHLLPFLKN